MAGICAALVFLCFAIYGQTLSHEFLKCDDDTCVTDNFHVQAGLSWANVVWAFTDSPATYFIPVTWMSHMTDCEIYGLHSWGHHLTNLVLHTVNSILLFLVFALMTRRLWASALVAALFAVHPLHVETVAWIAERKGILSMLFWTGAIGAYVWYRQRPNPVRFLAVAFVYLLGLMSKPTALLLPFVLLLLDYWPLDRIGRDGPPGVMARRAAWLAVEKIPFVLLTALFSATTLMLTALRSHHLDFGKKVPLLARCANALVVYVLYLVKSLWPSGLAVAYPHPITRPMWQVAGAVVILATITLFCLRQARRHPYLIVGWLWYLGSLVPVIGLVQAGGWSHADRYTYIPLIGIFVMVVWGAADLVEAWHVPRRAAAIASAILLVLFAVVSGVQVGCWRDTGTLFRHAIAVGQGSSLAYKNLGVIALNQRRYDEARSLLMKALDFDPEYVSAFDNLGVLALEQGRYDEAKSWMTKAYGLEPGDLSLLNDLGRLATQLRNYDEAKAFLTKALELEPQDPNVLNNMGLLAMQQRHYDEARAFLKKASDLDPQNPSVLNNMGLLAIYQRRYDEAKPWLMRALELKPGNPGIANNLGKVALEQRQYGEAGQWLTKALSLDPGYVSALYNMGVLAMRQEHYDEAKPWLTKALDLDPTNTDVLNDLGLLALYQKNYDEAKRCFMKTLNLDPGYVDSLNNMGLLAMDQGRFDEAKTWLAKALELNPGYVNALNNMGWCLMNQGRYEEAQHYFRKALETDPQFTKAMVNLGNTLAKLGRQAEADTFLRRAAELNRSGMVKEK